MASRWTEHAMDRMAAAGYRRGGARRAVLDLLGAQGCAVSAQEVEERLRGAAGRASVYRVLEELERLGLVSRIDVGDGVARFEPAHPGGEHHHHFVCRGCGELFPFDDDELERSIHRLAERLAFEVTEHEITLRGACRRCAAAA